jgi:myo-inositol 2-dehydrogenase/D-chiro-inositol 1-dehydrogenase
MIAGEHVGAYHATPGVQVVAVCDVVRAKAERLAARVDAAVMRDLDAILESGVEIVSVCTPPTTHAELTVAALEAGRNVLCEKPLARSLPDAGRIVQAARTAPGVLMIGQVSRYEPDHNSAKEVVDAGQLGALQMLSHSMATCLPEWSEGGWLSDLAMSGGPLLDLGVHSFDFLSWATGSTPVRVHAVGADTPVGASTYALATVRYASGAIALVESSWAHPVSHGFKLRAEVVGTDGRLSWDYDQLNGGTLHRKDGGVTAFGPLGARGFHAEVGAFVEAVRAGGPSPVPVDAGFEALRTALAALESVRTGETIDLTTWEAPGETTGETP